MWLFEFLTIFSGPSAGFVLNFKMQIGPQEKVFSMSKNTYMYAYIIIIRPIIMNYNIGEVVFYETLLSFRDMRIKQQFYL